MQVIHVFMMLMLILLIMFVAIAESHRREHELKSRQRLKRYQIKFYYKNDDIYIEPELRVFYQTFLRAYNVEDLKRKFKKSWGKAAIIRSITRINL